MALRALRFFDGTLIHPVGNHSGRILFWCLYQGGAELAFEIPTITPEIVVVIQGWLFYSLVRLNTC